MDMNIADRASAYRELRRVLKTGGTFGFYDPYEPDDGETPHYPLPWAETPATSTLLTKEATVAALEGAGYMCWPSMTSRKWAWTGLRTSNCGSGKPRSGTSRAAGAAKPAGAGRSASERAGIDAASRARVTAAIMINAGSNEASKFYRTARSAVSYKPNMRTAFAPRISLLTFSGMGNAVT